MSDIQLPGDPTTQTPLSNLPTNTFQLYKQMYSYYTTIVTNLKAQLLARTLDQPINAYSFDAGEGRQSTNRMTLQELEAALTRAVDQQLYYYRKMNGRGLMTLGLRRR